MRTSFMIRRWWIALVVLASLRLAHINLLWADEDYHLAAAIQILKGHVPYRDFWYDKPPMAGLFYVLVAGYPGWPLRILDVLFMLACCWVAYLFASAWWGRDEGVTAALLLAFFTTFYLPPATIPFAVDGLLLLPHLTAIYCAFRKQAFWSGVWCALGLLTNVKAAFIAATCGFWLMGDLILFSAGLLIPLSMAAVIGWTLGMGGGFYQQVWKWGLIYAGSQSSLGAALRRCFDWLAFHVALLAGAIVAVNEWHWRVWCWLVLSCLPIIMGSHFSPRYFFQILPVLVILGSRGIVLGVRRFGRNGVALLVVMLAIPMVRFGPHYGELILDNLRQRQTTWADTALDVDSQHVANLINARKRDGDTLFVWGYRPDIYVYTRLCPDGKFSDSQPLDGVPADRHLVSAVPSDGIAARENREEFVRSRPRFIVDGLGLLNAGLGLNRFPDLARWLAGYRLTGRTRVSLVYERLD